MAAGVKTAAIVNYEKYVTHPVPAAPAHEGDAKLKAKAATKAATGAPSRSSSRCPCKASVHSRKASGRSAIAVKQVRSNLRLSNQRPTNQIRSCDGRAEDQ